MSIEEKPTWKVDLEKPEFPKLAQNTTTDVVIVGGGMAGVLSAYLLSKAGKKVVILEKNRIGSGATEYTTAFITQMVDTSLEELSQLFGENHARMVWQSGADAIDLIESIIRDEKIDCEFTRTDVVVYANSEKEYEELQKEYQAESRFGFDVAAPVSDIKFRFKNYGYYQIKNQAKFHPLKFLMSLARICRERGVEIYEQTEVTKIQHQEAKVIVETEANQIESNFVVVAAYQPFHNRVRMFLKRGMYKSYVFEISLTKGIIPEGLYLNLNNPYHYFRIDPGMEKDRMILGGEDIKTIVKMDDEKNFKALEEYLETILPQERYEIVRRWAGQVLEPSDGLPLIGEVRDREYIASAFSGNGMTYSAISAMIFKDMVLGNQNIYAKVYDPKRIPSLKQLFIKGTDYVEEFFGGAAKNILKKKQSAEG